MRGRGVFIIALGIALAGCGGSGGHDGIVVASVDGRVVVEYCEGHAKTSDKLIALTYQVPVGEDAPSVGDWFSHTSWDVLGSDRVGKCDS